MALGERAGIDLVVGQAGKLFHAFHAQRPMRAREAVPQGHQDGTKLNGGRVRRHDHDVSVLAGRIVFAVKREFSAPDALDGRLERGQRYFFSEAFEDLASPPEQDPGAVFGGTSEIAGREPFVVRYRAKGAALDEGYRTEGASKFELILFPAAQFHSGQWTADICASVGILGAPNGEAGHGFGAAIVIENFGVRKNRAEFCEALLRETSAGEVDASDAGKPPRPEQ
jgi:hypothetical protein